MLTSVLMAIEIVDPVFDAMAEFRGLYLPLVWFFAWWLKNRSTIDNGTIPVVVVGLCVVGQVIGVLLTGGSITWATVMAGAMWGVGAVGAHSGWKNLGDFLKRFGIIKLGRG